MIQIWIAIFMVAITWGGWPLIVRSAGQVGYAGILTVTIFAVAPVLLASLQQGVASFHGFQMTWWKFVISGLLAGGGFIFYNQALGSSKMEVSTVVPLINSMMIVVTVVGGILFFSETVTLQKVLGVVLLVGGIFLLRP